MKDADMLFGFVKDGKATVYDLSAPEINMTIHSLRGTSKLYGHTVQLTVWHKSTPGEDMGK